MQAGDQSKQDEIAQFLAEEDAAERRKAEPPPEEAVRDLALWRSPRAGALNPTRQDNPLWHWMVRTRWSAYGANELLRGPSPFAQGPMWCFARYGKSETVLADGRVVHIGGEHEDSCDPDFFIYSDVIVIDANGGIAIHGYPDDAFPPTDFHSATLVGDAIFIIGGLGYRHQRMPGMTRVYRLLLDSMRIEAVPTHGEAPGWIYQHEACLAGDGRTIVVSGGERWFGEQCLTPENIDDWSLDTVTGEWRRLTRRPWQRWAMRRADGKGNRLMSMRLAHSLRKYKHLNLPTIEGLGDAPDFEALDLLYRIDETVAPPVQEAVGEMYAVVMDGVTLRFKEGNLHVEAIVEGALEPHRLHALRQATLALLARIEEAPWVMEDLPREPDTVG